MFKTGDKVIWDSGFGYDLAEFIGEGKRYYTYEIKLLSGCCVGQLISHHINEIIPYTEENYNAMVKEYRYEK